jgi:hypothetical protein
MHGRDEKNSKKIFITKDERKRPFERPRHSCEDNIRMNCGE